MKAAVISYLSNKKRRLFLASTGVVWLGLLLCIATFSTSKAQQTTDPKKDLLQENSEITTKKQPIQPEINRSLEMIEQRLTDVQKEISKKDGLQKTESLSLAIKDLSQTVSQFKSQAQNALSQSHSENEALNKKIEAMHTLILSLKGKDKKVQYLDAKALPFEVRAIDSVNEESVLALNYQYNNLALEKGDKLAGWKVIALNYAQQQVEFDDEKGAHVKITLNQKTTGEEKWG